MFSVVELKFNVSELKFNVSEHKFNDVEHNISLKGKTIIARFGNNHG